MPLKAIETEYKKYRMRSRLEARWAVVFDAMKFKWQYELEGVITPDGNYLPDFWIDTVSMWAEVKPADFTKHEKKLAQAVATASGYPVLMLVGTPESKAYAACQPDGGQEVDYYLINWHGQNRCYAVYSEEMWFPEIDRAVAKARGARFEHGEKPW